MLEKLYDEEAVSWYPLNWLDEIGSQVQPVAGFLVLACSYEGLELRALFARREASLTREKRLCKRRHEVVSQRIYIHCRHTGYALGLCL